MTITGMAYHILNTMQVLTYHLLKVKVLRNNGQKSRCPPPSLILHTTESEFYDNQECSSTVFEEIVSWLQDSVIIYLLH